MPPAKLSITLSVYKTISIAESDLFLQKMTKKRACEKTRVFSCVLLLMVIIIVILHKKGYSSPYPIRMIL